MSTGTRVVGYRVETRVRKGIPQVSGKARNDESSGCLKASRPRKCSAKLRVPKLRVATTSMCLREPFNSASSKQKIKSSTADFNRATESTISRVSARFKRSLI